MSTKPELHFPEMSALETVRDIKGHFRTACPFSTTFLFLKEGCRDVGQDTPLAGAIERAMKAAFLRWASSWIEPRLDDLQVHLTPLPVPEKDAMLKAFIRMEDLGGGFASKLASAAFSADRENWGRLYRAFPELFDRYKKMADEERGSDE